MSENKRIATKKAQTRNRYVRERARQKVEDKLTVQMGSRAKAKTHMKGKDVHKTGRGLELIGHKEHGKKHGRGNKGPRGKYRNK